MTRLRKMMLEELQRRNYAKSTVKAYVRIIQEFARHFHQPPDRLGPHRGPQEVACSQPLCGGGVSGRREGIVPATLRYVVGAGTYRISRPGISAQHCADHYGNGA